MTTVKTIAELDAIYPEAPAPASIVKEIARLTPDYRALVEASPFVALATVGPEGLDCSPRGDRQAVVRVLDDTTVALPDWRGNNRIDSLRNIVRDPRVALLFLIPGSGTTFRVNGEAAISIDERLLDAFLVEGKRPRSVILVRVVRAYFQCARAIVRADLWNPERHVAATSLPSAGQILANLSSGEAGGPAYDAEWPARALASLW